MKLKYLFKRKFKFKVNGDKSTLKGHDLTRDTARKLNHLFPGGLTLIKVKSDGAGVIILRNLGFEQFKVSTNGTASLEIKLCYGPTKRYGLFKGYGHIHRFKNIK